MNIKSAPVLLISLFFFIIIAVYNFSTTGEQQFSLLSQSFSNGKTYFVNLPNTLGDLVPYNGHYYWPEAPFPAILLMPFTLLFSLVNKFFLQGYLQFFISLGVYLLIYKLAKKTGYTLDDSLFLAVAFCFGSAFLGLAILPWSWFFAQIITVFCLLISLQEYFYSRNYLKIGLFSAAAIATRPDVAFVLTFYILSILLIEKSKQIKLFKLLVPACFTLAILAFYNFARFGNIFITGHSLGPIYDWFSPKYGVISLHYFPRNFFYMFWSLPDKLIANPWGISIFVTSPYLLYLFLIRTLDRISLFLLITTILVLIPLLLFYSMGARQFGYRYSMDFFPFLFFLIFREYKKNHKNLSFGIKLLFVFSAIFNFYLFSTVYG